ncbi:ASCH domain-containing protein [Leptolyngbya sp. PCC 6406]|uniref:ASCH domain-containing protein n=1 Tax=Leptolyngbya sp. PCC 6406 TaxID=1173264 RepID=UPI0002AC9D73|nr:ASCH domain-containing protein [Leptolyngbya sp. PCC 6406]
MLIKQQILEQIAQGSVSLAFRCWQRPTVRAGGQLQTAVGILAIDAVDVITLHQVTDVDAQQAGYASQQALIDELGQTDQGQLYRIQLHWAGPDPRVVLREQTGLSSADLEQVRQKLTQWDAQSKHGSWTMTVLNLIQTHPETRAAELAALAQLETATLKANVRKLKALGLTESIAKGGYRLSPRGQEVINRLNA